MTINSLFNATTFTTSDAILTTETNSGVVNIRGTANITASYQPAILSRRNLVSYCKSGLSVNTMANTWLDYQSNVVECTWNNYGNMSIYSTCF